MRIFDFYGANFSDIFSNDNTVTFSDNKIYINGKEVPSKYLKKGGSSCISQTRINGKVVTKYGKNTIIVKNNKITINGKLYDENMRLSSVEVEEVVENPRNSKFEISLEKKDTIEISGIVLHRIIALKDIVKDGKIIVKAGEKGGFVEELDNLSEFGSCWIYNDACVFNQAKVTDDAVVCDKAQVYNNSRVSDNAMVINNSEVYNNSKILDNGVVSRQAEVYNNSKVYNDAVVTDKAEVYNNSKVYGKGLVAKNAEVYNNSSVYDNASVTDNAEIDNSHIGGNAKVVKHAKITCCNLQDGIISKDMEGEGKNHFDTVIINGGIFSTNRTTIINNFSDDDYENE